MSDHWIQPCDSLLEGKDRCPNLDEKSFAQFAFRVVLYLVIFTINVILVNILIGQISKTLERVMQEDDKDYHMNVLELKAGFVLHSLRETKDMFKVNSKRPLTCSWFGAQDVNLNKSWRIT